MIYFDNFDPIGLFCFGSTTGRNLSPLLGPNLANLDDDGDSRKSAMNTLKSYVIGLDSKATPHFLAHVSSTEFQGNISNLTCSRENKRSAKRKLRRQPMKIQICLEKI